MRVRIFLKQPFFTLPGYIPRGALAVEGVLEEEKALGWVVAVDTWLSETGTRLEGAAQRVVIPGAKVDHVLLLG